MSKGTLNQVTLIGNLGADPEAKKSANGSQRPILTRTSAASGLTRWNGIGS